ncbi:MAG: DNRLRE domain-containing protein, partial [Planctomycetales bacterium]|nr:DNRLRE domain-containing protein [Planctomycetales bacterium]
MNDVNDSPIAVAGGPYAVEEGGVVLVDGSASSDPEGDIALFEWDFDYDGATFDVDASGVSPTFDASLLDGGGQRTVALRVLDAAGAWDVSTAVVNIENVAPSINNLDVLTGGTDLGDALTHWWTGDVNGSDAMGTADGALEPGALAGVPGLWGGAFQFNGSSGGLALGNVPSFDYSQSSSFTYEAWINSSGQVGADSQLILSTNYVCSPTAQTFGLTGGAPFLVIRDAADNSVLVVAPEPIADGTWTHVVGTREVTANGNFLHLFVDGDLVATVEDTTTAALSIAGPDYVGRRYPCATQSVFNGLVDSIRTYDRALTPAEVIARFGNSDFVVELGSPITFSASATDPANAADPLAYTWDFGDGSAVDAGIDLTSISHAFMTSGTFTVLLSVDDGDGGVAVRETSVTVVDLTPTADPGGPYTVAEGASITLDGSASQVANGGSVAAYEWDFDYDGATFDVDASGAAARLDAAGLDGPGAITIALRVTDAVGLTDIATAVVEISNVAPSIALSGASSVAEGTEYTLTLGPVSDPGVDTVTQYVVHWGDGTSDVYLAPGAVTHTYADGIVPPGSVDPVAQSLVTIEDTFITDAAGLGGPNSTHATDGGLYSIKYFNPGGGGSLATRPMFKFDLTGLAGREVSESAIFRSYLVGPVNSDYYHSEARQVDLHSINDAWSDASVTWNSQPGTSVVSSQLVTYAGPADNNRYIEWTIPRQLVQSWIDDPSSNHGLMIVNVLPDAFFYDLVFSSIEHPGGMPATLEIPLERETSITVDLVDE